MARDTSFSYSFLVLPAAQRHAIVAVWDFCRAVDDAVDEEPVRGARSGRSGRVARRGGSRLRRRAAADASRAGTCSRSSRRFHLSREPFETLVDGVEMDLRRQRYETFDELVEYCRASLRPSG